MSEREIPGGKGQCESCGKRDKDLYEVPVEREFGKRELRCYGCTWPWPPRG